MANMMTPADKRHMYDHILGCILDQMEAEEDGIAATTLRLFAEKSAGYGGTAINFGTKGELIEISRKFWRLFGIIEEGQPEVAGEGVEELCMDMVGHLWMMIFHKRHEDPVLAPGEKLYRPMGEGLVSTSHDEQGRPFGVPCTCGGTSECRAHPRHGHGPGGRIASDGCTCESHGIGLPRFDHECPIHGHA